MALTTFGDAWRRVRLHVPDAPFGLCREWTQHAYEDLVGRRPWQFGKILGQMAIPASRSVTVTFAVGSQNVTSVAGFLSTDLGLQIRVDTLPVYTLATYTSTSAMTLDQAWSGTAGAQTATILGLYQTLPADFGAFLQVTDPTLQRPIPWWFTQEELDRVDPARTSTADTARLLVSKDLSPITSTRGQVRYEWWPAPTTAASIPYQYRQQAPILADTDPLLGVLDMRTLTTGALAYCAAWPGTATSKNPYFNIALHAKLLEEFDRDCARLELRDDDQSQQTWVDPRTIRRGVDLAADTALLRASDASISDYF